jgi:hypothetical protein
MDRLLIRVEVLPLPVERDLRFQLREHLGNGQIQSHPSFLLCRRVALTCDMDTYPHLQTRAKRRKEALPCRNDHDLSCKETMLADQSAAICDKEGEWRAGYEEISYADRGTCDILRDLRDNKRNTCDMGLPL